MTECGSYYQNSRPEVVQLVPAGARDVVDVGCGAGILGRALKEARPGIRVRGVEIMPDPAAQAKKWLDDVLCGSGELGLPEGWPAPDCVIFADVLEHMADPWSALKGWTERLASGGSVVMSIPNAGHHSALGQLLAGHWRYQDAGILDRTHLRFFTRESVMELATGAGLRVVRLERVLNCPWHGIFRNLLRLMVRRQARREPLAGLRQGLRRFLLDYSTFQFLVVAEKP